MDSAAASGKTHWESVVIGVSVGGNEEDVRLESPIPDALLVAKTARDVGLCSDMVFTVTNADQPCTEAILTSALTRRSCARTRTYWFISEVTACVAHMAIHWCVLVDCSMCTTASTWRISWPEWWMTVAAAQ